MQNPTAWQSELFLKNQTKLYGQRFRVFCWYGVSAFLQRWNFGEGEFTSFQHSHFPVIMITQKGKGLSWHLDPLLFQPRSPADGRRGTRQRPKRSTVLLMMLLSLLARDATKKPSWKPQVLKYSLHWHVHCLVKILAAFKSIISTW